MWLCGSTGKRDTICHLFSFCYVFSHHPRAGIWERLQALGNIHLNIHLCVFFFSFHFSVSFLFFSFPFSFSFFLFLLSVYYRALYLFISLSLFSAWSCECSTDSYMASLEPWSSRPTKYSTHSAVFGGVCLFNGQERKFIIHEALEALPERRICTSAMGFNGTLGGICLWNVTENHVTFWHQDEDLLWDLSMLWFSAIPEESW